MPRTGMDLESFRQCEAVQLFVIAGQRARPGFDLSAGNLDSVMQICRLTEGMPLGLLLAATWLDTYSTPEIAEEIARGLDFLSADWDGLPARQRSLRATFDYSWGLLKETDQRILSSLSVFQGGCTRQAAGRVAGATPKNLRALVEKSMLQRSPSGRYWMHALLRQYAAEKLAEHPVEEAAVRETHAGYYLRKLPDWSQALKGTRQADALGEMDLEIENLSVAWTRASETMRVADLAQGLEGYCLYYDLRARLQAGQRACQNALDHLHSSQHLLSAQFQVMARAWKAHFLRQSGDYEDAAQQLGRILAAFEDPDSPSRDTRLEQALVHFELGHARLFDDRQAAREHFKESLRLYKGTGDEWWQAQALAGLGLAAHHAGTFAEAVEYYRCSLKYFELLEDPNSIAGVLIEIGHNLLRQGLLEEGETYIRRGCELYKQMGDRISIANNFLQLGRLCFWRGEFGEALSISQRIEPVFKELGALDSHAFCVSGAGIMIVLQGSYEDALLQGQQGLTVAQDYEFQRWQALSYWVMGMAKLGMSEFRSADNYLQSSADAYRAIAQNDELAWALAARAYAELELEHDGTDLKSMCEALQLGLEIHGLFPILLALPAVGLWLIQQSPTVDEESAASLIERAVELYALTRRYPTAGNSQWFEDVAGNKISAAAASLTPEVVEAAKARGRGQDAFEVAQSILDEYCNRP